jgi:hypothetical protein
VPLYCYEDKKTGKQVEVLRSFDEYEKTPDRDEAKDWTAEEYAVAEWQRVLGTPQLVRGRNWSGSKGNWLVLLGAYACTQLTNWIA